MKKNEEKFFSFLSNKCQFFLLLRLIMTSNKRYYNLYKTPSAFSDMLMESNGDVLTGLRFVGSDFRKDFEESDLSVFNDTRKWLEMYFSGQEPDFTPDYKVINQTPFRNEVYEILLSIPFGKVLTYGDIAKTIANNRKIEKMSAQAVGGAVGSNPICLIIPCHRVVAANNKIGGYGGGIQNKVELLKLEGAIF